MGFAIPLCRWPFPRLCGFPSPGHAGQYQPTSVPSRRAWPSARVSHNLIQPAGRNRASTSQGLSVPSALEGTEVHLPRDLPHPATFRPQGLVTLSAVYALRARAGLVSYRRRSWDFALRSFLLPEGTDRVSAGVNPPTVSPVGAPALLRWAGPTGRGSWAFTLPGVPGDRHRISAASAGCSLGLHPLRACGSRRRTGFRPRSSHALQQMASRPTAGASECPTSSTFARSDNRRAGRRTGQPFQGSGTGAHESV